MQTFTNFPDSIEDLCIACVPVGSRVTCNPPPTDTDQDILCLVEPEDLETFYQWLEDRDWEYEGEEKYQLSEFASYRKDFTEHGEVNLIVTCVPKWFDAFMDATRECKEKNVLTKAGRIEVFQKYIPKKKISEKLKKDLADIMAEQTGDLWPSQTYLNQAYNVPTTQQN